MIPLELGPSSEPFEAEALAAQGPVAQVLAKRLLRTEEAQLDALRGVVAGDLSVILGPFEKLPWVDRVTYLGAPASLRDDPAPWALLIDPPRLLREHYLALP
jgi:hypothetical protein